MPRFEFVIVIFFLQMIYYIIRVRINKLSKRTQIDCKYCKGLGMACIILFKLIHVPAGYLSYKLQEKAILCYLFIPLYVHSLQHGTKGKRYERDATQIWSRCWTETIGNCFSKTKSIWKLKKVFPKYLVEFKLLICLCIFVCLILVTLCSLLCMSVFHVWYLSLDCILFITAITLVLLITLWLSFYL